MVVDRPTVEASLLLPGVDRLMLVLDTDPSASKTRPVTEERSAAFDSAVGPALLRHVGAGPSESTGTGSSGAGSSGTVGWLRFYRPAPTVGFSSRDSRTPGYAAAAAAAREHGFSPVVRAPGGHAAAYHRSCLCFDIVVPDPAGRVDVVAQLEQWGHFVAQTLRSLGVDATVGALPDEYCPGRFSVQAGGAKVVGAAGRRRAGAALVGGVIVVADAAPLRAVIGDVYAALGLPCDLSTVGSVMAAGGEDGLVAGEPDAGGSDSDAVDLVTAALVAALHPLVPMDLSPLPDRVVTDALDALSTTPSLEERDSRA